LRLHAAKEMMMNGWRWGRITLVGLMISLAYLTGCPAPRDDAGSAVAGRPDGESTAPAAPSRVASAKAEDIAAAKRLLDSLGANAKYTLLPGDVITEIVIQDGSALAAEALAVFGKLTDLEKLQVFNFRSMNDEMAAQLSGLSNLTTLALTNSVINDPTVAMIAKSFPKLKDLDLSSNTNLTNSVLRVICELTQLERLTLVQNRFNDLGTSRLANLKNLRALDLRGNMEAGDMTMEIIGALPKLTALRHRSTTVSDFGMEYLAQCKTLDSLLIQDFAATGQTGQHLAKLDNLTQLEIFRCQGFGSDGVLALAGMKLTRLTLRDLPMVDDQAMAVFAELPQLKRLYLHELDSVSDHGLQNLAALKSLELLDIWTVPQMTDATVEVIAGLENLKELSIRTTGVTDAAVDRLLAMPNLQSLTFKDNGMVTAEGLKKLTERKWSKLDAGSGDG
jgi:hypothetical protein